MMSAEPRREFILAIHPTARGFGWVVFDGPLALFDWALVETPKDKNTACLQKVAKLIERFQPETLILEAFEGPAARRSERIKRLGRGLATLAATQGVDVVIYSRFEVQTCFGTMGARSRDEIASVVALNLPMLQPRLPQKRKCWKSEDRRLALFSAAALALTHYRYQAQFFFEDLAKSAT